MKQGCTLASSLFNLFINDIVLAVSGEKKIPVKPGNRTLSVLHFVNNLLLISHSQIGLQRQLKALDFKLSNCECRKIKGGSIWGEKTQMQRVLFKNKMSLPKEICLN